MKPLPVTQYIPIGVTIVICVGIICILILALFRRPGRFAQLSHDEASQQIAKWRPRRKEIPFLIIVANIIAWFLMGRVLPLPIFAVTMGVVDTWAILHFINVCQSVYLAEKKLKELSTEE